MLHRAGYNAPHPQVLLCLKSSSMTTAGGLVCGAAVSRSVASAVRIQEVAMAVSVTHGYGWLGAKGRVSVCRKTKRMEAGHFISYRFWLGTYFRHTPLYMPPCPISRAPAGWVFLTGSCSGK